MRQSTWTENASDLVTYPTDGHLHRVTEPQLKRKQQTINDIHVNSNLYYNRLGWPKHGKHGKLGKLEVRNVHQSM